MKIQSIFLSLFLSMLLIPEFGLAQKDDKIVIENESFRKTFFASSEKAGKIEVSIQTKADNKIITSEEAIPYFEFVIDNKVVSSNAPLWVFKKQTTRKMGNGGTEYQLIFEGKAAPVNGLQVVLLQQFFPNSTLMREKLVLESMDKSFELNKLNGKLHFKFPGYSVKNDANSEVNSTEIQIANWEKEPVTFGEEKKGNHMYYPNVRNFKITENLSPVKGPISISTNGKVSWFTAYEHASQDNLNGLFNEQKRGKGNLINDAMQGTKGVFNFPISEEDFKFIGISTLTADKKFDVSIDILRGGYLEGEKIDKTHPYSTVWNATGFYAGSDLEDGKKILRNYLMNQICENPHARVSDYYYNTWGLQRQDRTKPLRGILTYDRIFEEIDYAAEMGVDIFVLDDGWENAMGEWFPNKERFPEGLAPIKKRLDKYGIKMGLWYSPMGIDSTTQRYKKYQEWIIKDSENKPISAQWDHPAFDFVSDFFNVFIDDCKKMVDEGCRFMKWDAINTFYSSLPNLEHGSENYTKDELRARYEYLLPIFVVKAMEILTDYEPELVIEIDLTEARRVMVGLAPLSQGKLFWMNNGASWYNDYSTFRTKSMRTIANEFAGIIPLELFTYANYPQNEAGDMKYNVRNSILAGHGFWGNLQLTSAEDRKWIKTQVENSKKVLPYIKDVNPEVNGKVGDSPEIYTIVNSEEAAGQIIAFSEETLQKEKSVDINAEKLLGVLDVPFSIENNKLNISLNFQKEQSSAAAFILPKSNSSINASIISSTSSIVEINSDKKGLNYTVPAPGEQQILWPEKDGKPSVNSNSEFDFQIEKTGKNYLIKVQTKAENSKVILEKKF